MKRIVIICLILLMLPAEVFSQIKSRVLPSYLAGEAYRLSSQCYFFQEYVTFIQKKRRYVLTMFLSREAVRPAWGSKIDVTRSSCGPKQPQARLYRFLNDTAVAFCDSVLINGFSASIGLLSDFDKSGLNKILINQSCNPPQAGMTPLLCNAISVFEISEKTKFRNVLQLGDVPERWVNNQPSGLPLEPVVADNIDKTPYPELLAIDDFFEGDPAFRADDFPKITLIYGWDPKARLYRNVSEQFPFRFQPSDKISVMPDDSKLVTVIEKVMALAAVKRLDDAKKFMDLNLTPAQFARWQAQAPERGSYISMARLKEKLARCIVRFK